MNDSSFQNSIYFEYLRDGKIEGVIEIQPEFTKRGYLKLWHSFIIKAAMRNEHPDGTIFDEVKIHHGNPFVQDKKRGN